MLCGNTAPNRADLIHAPDGFVWFFDHHYPVRSHQYLFEGEVPHNTKARHGRSKEKRTDCPLVTLGLVLDGSGFVRRSQTFAGNVSEASTLETMLQDLNAPSGAWW